MTRDIITIVEGHSEMESVPLLIRRIAVIEAPGLVVRIRPIKIHFSKLLKAGELERAVQFAARTVDQARVLILADCEDDCPAQLGPELLRRAMAARPDLPVRVVLAKREFESWFIAAALSLRGKRGLAKDLEPLENPESKRGAKEWLEEHMPVAQGYSEVLDQPALTALFDLQAARRTDSFDKCYREIVKLLR